MNTEYEYKHLGGDTYEVTKITKEKFIIKCNCLIGVYTPITK